MRLLIITQKINEADPILGFFVRWVEEFAKYYERVVVICLEKGEYSLPPNVRVLSLGKESMKTGFNPFIRRVVFIRRFLKCILRERRNYDHVFVHMNQIYVILGYLVWRATRKKVGLWYAHGHVPLTLRLAEKLADLIFTSSPHGFRLASFKVKTVGQGIDINLFVPSDFKKRGDELALISVGRISPVKDYETIMRAIKTILSRDASVSLRIIGGPADDGQRNYMIKLKNMAREMGLSDNVQFLGPMPHSELVPHLQRSTLFVNMSRTGSMDKAVLEAMACGLPVITCNESFEDIPACILIPAGDHGRLVEEVLKFAMLSDSEKYRISKEAREYAEKHSVHSLVEKIIDCYAH